MMPSAPPKYLLLLPPPAAPPTYASLKATYGSPITSVLKSVAAAPNRTSSAAVLEIAVPCTHLHYSAHLPRSHSYDQTQRLVAGLYQLLSVICGKNEIDIEGPGGANARVLLLAYDKTQSYAFGDDHLPSMSIKQGPVIDLPTLVQCRRNWERIYSVNTSSGEAIVKFFTSLSDRLPGEAIPLSRIERVTGGVELLRHEERSAADIQRTDAREYHHVAVGGTFDHLHAGHKLLLTMTAFLVEPVRQQADPPRRMTVGITGDELLKNKKYAEFLESWEQREEDVSDFMSAILDFHPQSSCSVERLSEQEPNGVSVHRTFDGSFVVQNVKIADPFGPTITDESIKALVVSGETRSGGKAINDRREGKGWQPLHVFEVDVLDTDEAREDESSDKSSTKESFDSKISSTAIRRQRYEKVKSQGNLPQ